MNFVIQTFPLIAVLFCAGCGAARQSPGAAQGPADRDPCGDPKVESRNWESVSGRVIRVVDGDTIIISFDNRERVLVHLAGIAAPPPGRPLGHEAQRFLEHTVGGKRVEVWVNPSLWTFKRPRPTEVPGVVYLRGADMQDVNLALVRAGLARHQQAAPYTISRYAECRYEKAEDEARAARRGLWHGQA